MARDRAEYNREYRAANRERALGWGRANYAKHREKRLAAKKAEYERKREEILERNRQQYAKHREARVEWAREYRRQRREVLAAEASERYYANREAIIARRKELRKRPEARAKAYAAMRRWLKNNPDKALHQHAKRLISEQTGMRIADIPNDLADAKVEQLLIIRWVREAIAMEARQGQDREDGPDAKHDSAGRRHRQTSVAITQAPAR